MIIAFTTGEWIGIVAIVGPLVVGVLAYAFKSKILNEVNTKVDPLEDRIVKVEAAQQLYDTKMDTVLEGIKDIKTLIKERDQSTKDHFDRIYDKLEKKADKK